MSTNCRLTIRIGAISLLLAVLSAFSASAGDPKDFQNESGDFILPTTEGLAGLDSMRARVDSMYYQSRIKSPQRTAADTKVIYGDDDRLDVYEVTDPNLLKLAQAACVIVSSGEIFDNGDGTYTLSTNAWTRQWGYPLCPEEPFAGQQVLGWCSGFLVANDILVTAGHCVSPADCGNIAFVFGFQQLGPTTDPEVIVSADNIYFCSNVIDFALAGDLDHSVVRLDRPVIGREPLEIRRSSVVPEGDSVVVVGHPTNLPMKIAGGAIVQDNEGSTPWFQANVDTYAGNSGSMVVNTNTWVVEGILVRGATDFAVNGSCVESNRVPNSGDGSGNPWEEISKTITFAEFIPPLVSAAGALFQVSEAYACADTINLELRDLNLAGSGTHSVTVITAFDSETVVLSETGSNSAIFTGFIETESGSAVADDGRLQVVHGDIITTFYVDADDGTGSPAYVEKLSVVDCQAPIISNVILSDIQSTSVRLTFDTDEPAVGAGRVGLYCINAPIEALGPSTTSHSILVGGMEPLTEYRLKVLATDAAGNVAEDINTGFCYVFTTVEPGDYFTQLFSSGNDIEGSRIEFSSDGSPDFYSACRTVASAFPTDQDSATSLSLGDDSYAEITLLDGKQIYIYGNPFSSLFVCSNGFVTFGQADTYYLEGLLDHFEIGPRISAYWDDLSPNIAGKITYEQLSDRLVVTWDGVPQYNATDSNSFQLEMFFNGTIAITHLRLDSDDGLVGISEGSGMPQDFVESDLSAYVECEQIGCCRGKVGNVDGDPTELVDIGDLTMLLDKLFISQTEFDCPEEANVDMDPEVLIDIGDITLMIRHLFITLEPLSDCP